MNNRKKFCSKIKESEELLSELEFDLLDENYLEKIIIRDPNDQIILNSAVENNVDYLLTGDKDFLVLNIQNPKCVSINEMIEILNIKIKV